MTTSKDPLILDLVEWLATEPRPYDEVMAAWRTSCPDLMIWEDAVDRGLVAREHRDGIGTYVSVTPQGRDLLASEGRLAR